MIDNSSNKRIAKNSIFLSIRMVIVLCISLYTTRAILDALGVVDYGVYNVVCGFVAMFTFLNTSMSNGIQRFFNYELGRNGNGEGLNKVYCTSVYIQLILALIIICLTETIGLWYLTNKMIIPSDRITAAKWIYELAILNFLFIIMQAPYVAAIMAHEHMGYYALVSVVDAILKLGIVFLLHFFSQDRLVLYGGLMTGISCINYLLYYIYCKIHFREIKLHINFDKPLFRSMLGFSGWNLFGSLSGVVQEQGTNLIINFFYGPVVNAARGIAAQVNGGLQNFVQNITLPVRPQVVQSYSQGKINRTINLTYSISKLSCCFFAMMAIPISMEIDYVLHLWLGNNIPAHTSLFTILVLLTALTSNLNSAISNVVHATGKMKHYQIWGSLVKMCSVPLAFILLRRYDYPEIALASVWLMNLLGHIAGLFVLRTLIPFSILDYAKEVVCPILVVINVGIACVWPIVRYLNQGWFRLFVVILVSCCAICSSLYCLGLDQSERQLVRGLFHSVIKKKI